MYRDRYEKVRESKTQVLAVSTDKPERQAKFRESIGAPFPFLADTDGALTRLYGVKLPILKMAKRVTFVVGPGLQIANVFRGGQALDPNGAIEAAAIC